LQYICRRILIWQNRSWWPRSSVVFVVLFGTSLAAVQRWPQLLKWVQSLDLGWNIFPDNLKGFDKSMFPDTVYALVTITETSLNPHRFTHQLTKLANSAGIYTATMQHGYENVGLSYSDELQDIKHIKFAAHQIFTWGHLETLHTEIPLKTKLKCYPVAVPNLMLWNRPALMIGIGMDDPL